MPRPEVACLEKIPFATKRWAKVGARQLRHHGHALGRPYRCPACHLWHLTTASATERERLRAIERANRNGLTLEVA